MTSQPLSGEERRLPNLHVITTTLYAKLLNHSRCKLLKIARYQYPHSAILLAQRIAPITSVGPTRMANEQPIGGGADCVSVDVVHRATARGECSEAIYVVCYIRWCYVYLGPAWARDETTRTSDSLSYFRM